MKFNYLQIVCGILVLSSISVAQAFGPARTKDTRPIIELEREVTSSFRIGSLTKLQLKTMARQDAMEVVQGTGDRLEVWVHAASRDPDNLFRLFSTASVGMAGSSVGVFVNETGTYFCSILQMNGKISALKGMCITKIRVILPAGSPNATIMFNDKVIQGELSLEDFITAITEESFDKDRTEALRNFLANSAIQFGASEVLRILKAYDFDRDRNEACQLLSGRVLNPVDAESLSSVFDFKTHSEECLSNLAKKYLVPSG